MRIIINNPCINVFFCVFEIWILCEKKSLTLFFFFGGGGMGGGEGGGGLDGWTDEQAQTNLLLRSWGHSNAFMYKLSP